MAPGASRGVDNVSNNRELRCDCPFVVAELTDRRDDGRVSVSAQGQLLSKRTRANGLVVAPRPSAARDARRARATPFRDRDVAPDVTTTRIDLGSARRRSWGPVSRFGRVVWVLVAAAGLAIADAVSTLDSRAHVARPWSVAGYAAAGSLPLITVVGRLRRGARGRAGWGALAGSLAASAAAGVIVASRWHISSVAGLPPTVSLLRVLAAALLVLGVAGVVHQRLAGAAATARLDAVIAGLAVSAGVGLAVVERELASLGVTSTSATSLFLALCFVALVAVLVAGVTPVGRRAPASATLAFAGASAWAVGFALALHRASPWPDGGGRDLNVASLVGAVLIGFAAASNDAARPARRARSSRVAPVASLVPVGAGLAAVALVAVSWRDAQRLGRRPRHRLQRAAPGHGPPVDDLARGGPPHHRPRRSTREPTR